jgi:hypothetical protein
MLHASAAAARMPARAAPTATRAARATEEEEPLLAVTGGACLVAAGGGASITEVPLPAGGAWLTAAGEEAGGVGVGIGVAEAPAARCCSRVLQCQPEEVKRSIVAVLVSLNSKHCGTLRWQNATGKMQLQYWQHWQSRPEANPLCRGSRALAPSIAFLVANQDLQLQCNTSNPQPHHIEPRPLIAFHNAGTGPDRALLSRNLRWWPRKHAYTPRNACGAAMDSCGW